MVPLRGGFIAEASTGKQICQYTTHPVNPTLLDMPIPRPLLCGTDQKDLNKHTFSNSQTIRWSCYLGFGIFSSIRMAANSAFPKHPRDRKTSSTLTVGHQETAMAVTSSKELSDMSLVGINVGRVFRSTFRFLYYLWFKNYIDVSLSQNHCKFLF